MVQRYTRSVTFEDSLRHYKAPLGEANLLLTANGIDGKRPSP